MDEGEQGVFDFFKPSDVGEGSVWREIKNVAIFFERRVPKGVHDCLVACPNLLAFLFRGCEDRLSTPIHHVVGDCSKTRMVRGTTSPEYGGGWVSTRRRV